MTISLDQVQQVATLARLELTAEELQTFTTQLGAILEYIEQLNELDLTDVPGTSHAVPLVCPLREDEPAASPHRQAIMDQAPQTQDHHFVVPKIID